MELSKVLLDLNENIPTAYSDQEMEHSVGRRDARS
jgi:hypothetical protein